MSHAASLRRPLDRDRIVTGLLEIGVDRFSMHSLARHLGVSATALYRYFSSREELLAAAMDTFCERLELPDEGLPYPDYLTRLGHAFRSALLSMPGAASYGEAIGPSTPAAFSILEAALRVLRAAGFTSSGAWRAYSLVVMQAFQLVQSQERFEKLVARHGPGGYRVYQLSAAEKQALPELARVVESQRFDFDASFAESIACVVAGIVVQHERGEL